MKILNFGSCNIDTVYQVPHILRPGETVSATSVASFPGGKGLNQSIALARSGALVYHAGCIGQDGNMLVDIMSSCGIDLCYLKTVDDKTGLAIIQVEQSGENSILIYSGANGRITETHIDSVLKDFQPGDFLLAQNEIAHVPYLISQAARKGLQVVFNPSPFNGRIRDINLRDLTYMILNEVEAEGFWGTSDPDELLPILRTQYPWLKIVLTLGKNGSVYFGDGYCCRQSAYRVEIVDTTAAGDTFTGYFISGIAAGKTPQSAMRYASAAAALAVSREGAASSIPAMQTVEEKLGSLLPYDSRKTDTMRDTVIRFMDENYRDGTLEKLANALGYTASYTSTWLKTNLNTTFSQLIQDKRCEVAAKYLRGTDISVADIIHMVGYHNESFFRRIFGEKYHCTPLKYRERKEESNG